MIYARHKSVVGPEPLKKKKEFTRVNISRAQHRMAWVKIAFIQSVPHRNMKIIMAPILSLLVTSLGHVIDRLSALCPL